MALSPQPADSNTFVVRADGRIGLYKKAVQGAAFAQRFVVVFDAKHDSCVCALPIRTYGGQGVAKRGVKKSEHAIIYTGNPRCTPTLEAGELPSRRDEAGMLSTTIRVDVDCMDYALDPRSRVNFGSLVLVPQSKRVKSLGMVNRASIEALQHRFSMVWGDRASFFRNYLVSFNTRHVHELNVADQIHHGEEDGVDDGGDDGELSDLERGVDEEDGVDDDGDDGEQSDLECGVEDADDGQHDKWSPGNGHECDDL